MSFRVLVLFISQFCERKLLLPLPNIGLVRVNRGILDLDSLLLLSDDEFSLAWSVILDCLCMRSSLVGCNTIPLHLMCQHAVHERFLWQVASTPSPSFKAAKLIFLGSWSSSLKPPIVSARDWYPEPASDLLQYALFMQDSLFYLTAIPSDKICTYSSQNGPRLYASS